AEIDGQTGGGSNRLQHLVIDDFPGFGTVEIYKVKILYTMILKLLRHIHRIFVIYRLLIIIPLYEADTFSVNQINSRYYSHTTLFSGLIYKTPFVLARVRSFTSLRIAALIARAKALKIASILWCSFSPSASICRLTRALSEK